MEPMPQSLVRRAGLPLILVAAVIQGWSLYALHWAIEAHRWPATHLAWLFSLYTVAFLAPTTVQLMVEYADRSSVWVLTALLAVALFYFGWHYGGAVADFQAQSFEDTGETFPLAFVLMVWWLLTLPFIQSRVATGLWKPDYQRLFAFAWRNVISLGEATLFTGLFWLLLFLWQSLFHMLGMDFFRTLFDKPTFAYPVTAIVYGCALQLIGSIDALISAVLEQILNVLKWLATVAGALLILFTFALLTKLPGLVFSGRRAIGAVWLLWLVAVIVLFLNAAYRDGTVERPYPRWIAQALRFAVPLTVIITATALYALIVRSSHFGLTVGRVWGFIVAVAAVVYSVGYSIATFRRGPWLSMASRVNVIAAIALIVVVGLALTPLLSPYRLAAISQYRLILDRRYAALMPSPGSTPFFHPSVSPFDYLARFTGNYGRKELEHLRTLQSGQNAPQIRELAAQALKPNTPFGGGIRQYPNARAIVVKLPLYPAGRTLDPDLSQLVAADWSRLRPWVGTQNVAQTAAGVFVDLNGGGDDDFVVLSMSGGSLYRKSGGHWEYVGALYTAGTTMPWQVTLNALSAGHFAAVVPAWKDLSVGTRLYRVAPQRSVPGDVVR
jgi:Domain of unknown function (DUF4153)